MRRCEDNNLRAVCLVRAIANGGLMGLCGVGELLVGVVWRDVVVGRGSRVGGRGLIWAGGNC
jgi:hypothetical protein